MKISPTYNSKDWYELRLTSTSNLEDWKKAIEIFDDRYKYRFINQINSLRFNSSLETAIYSGFVIMAINCLLIETLNQFYYGVNDTDVLKKDKNIKDINSIEDAFWNFFQSSKFFNKSFDKQSAQCFYKHIRCGLLHQAETKMSSIIHINHNQKVMLEKLFVGKVLTGISIRRDLFTDFLFEEYNDYKKRLLSPLEKKLRIGFMSKMDLICDIKR